MPYLSKYLTNEVGIQLNAVQTPDNEDSNTIYPILTGRFKRGRLDQPMLITQGNIRTALGHDANNQDYQIVQDYLNTGVASVYVLRVVD